MLIFKFKIKNNMAKTLFVKQKLKHMRNFTLNLWNNTLGENVWKFQAFLLVSRITNWRLKYSAFWKKLTPCRRWTGSGLSLFTIQRKLEESDFEIEPSQKRKRKKKERKLQSQNSKLAFWHKNLHKWKFMYLF